MPVSPVPALSQDSHIFVPAMLMAALGRGKGEVIPISWRPREIKQFLTKNWGLKPGQLQSPVLSTVHQTPCTFAQVWYAALSSTEEGTHTDCTQLHATWRTVVFFIFFLLIWRHQVLVAAHLHCSAQHLLLQHLGFSLAVAHGLSRCGTEAQLPSCTWDPSSPTGVKPTSPALEGGFFFRFMYLFLFFL